MLEVGEDGVTTLTVLEGEVAFFNDLGRVTVRPNEQSAASASSPPTRPMAVDPSQYLQWEASLQNAWLDFEIRRHPAETRERLLDLAEETGREAEADPADFEAQLRAGDVRHDLGEFPEAEAYYRRALDVAPDDPRAQASLGHALLQQGQAAEAIEVFRAAERLAPRPLATWWVGLWPPSRTTPSPTLSPPFLPSAPATRTGRGPPSSAPWPPTRTSSRPTRC